MRDVDNISEAKVELEGKFSDDQDVRRLWAKNELIFRKLAERNKPLIVTGKQCMDFVLGKIFDDSTRATYEQIQNKICIEPRVLKQRMNAAVGLLMQARRKGSITSEGSTDAQELYAGNALLKFVEKETKLQFITTDMLFRGCTTGYYQALIFDKSYTAHGDPLGGLDMITPPWDSVVCNNVQSPAGDDLTDFIWIARKTRSELLDENPDRKADIEKHFERLNQGFDGYGTNSDGDGFLTAEDMRYLNFDVLTSMSNFRLDGKLLCVNRFCVQKVDMEVAVRIGEDETIVDYQILPENWGAARIASWKAAHPEYTYKKEKTKVLWVCRWTSDGLMLLNEPHFFQETDTRGNPVFPVALFTAQVVDGVPTGPGPDDRLLVLMKAIAETEFLHDVRTGSGDVFAYKSGTIVNHQDLPTELSIGNGIIEVDGEIVTGPIREAAEFMKRTPNTVYGEYSDRVDAQLDNADSMTASARGQVTSDRISGKMQQTNIAATVVGYSVVAENMNKMLERVRNLICMFIPYAFTEEQVVQVYDDDTGEDMRMTVNETEYDIEGAPKVVANDLSSVKWRWRLTEGDDSPTAKQAELNEMLIFWNTTAPVLIDADESLMTLASVLMSMGNKTAQQIGRVIAEKAKVQAESMSQQKLMETMATLEEKKAKASAELTKAKRAGFSFSITPDDLAQIPGLYKVLVDSQYINPNNNMFQQPPGGPNEQAA